MDEELVSWENLIIHNKKNPKFKSRTCRLFNHESTSTGEQDKLCHCERMIRRHSYTGKPVEFEKATDGIVDPQLPQIFSDLKHTTQVEVNVFGTLKSTGCKFLRIDNRMTGKDVFELISEDCENQRPALILSIYGGAKYFTMTERLEKEFIRGVIDAATMADAWILTAGISNGVSKLVGEGISHHRLLREKTNKVKCIGLTMWGTINENTRLKLKNTTQRQIPDNAQEDKETIEENHTHCILLDGGKLNEHLSDSQRDQFVKEACTNKDNNHTCYPVTIIVEGGFGSLEVIENDIKEKRPVVLIQGSGRLADILASLIEQTSNSDGQHDWNPSIKDVEQAIHRYYSFNCDPDVTGKIRRILKILATENRHLLHVFSLDRDKNVAETIFKAIFAAKNKARIIVNDKTESKSSDDVKQRRQDEDKLVDLALEWNYFDGALLILQTRQDEIAKKKDDFIEDKINRQKELFRRSLEKNRPTFIEYFLSAGFDPFTLAEGSDVRNYHEMILDLYFKSYETMNKSHKERVELLFGSLPLQAIKQLDYRINKLVGSFFGLIYAFKHDSFKNRVQIDLSNHLCTCCGEHRADENDYGRENNQNAIEPSTKPSNNQYTRHHILRDLFLWSIFMDMPEMAKVLLLHIRSRICAGLIASALFKKYSELSPTVDMKDKFAKQALEFETNAAMSLNKCYEYNEKRACELLVRQIPLFGNITCIQVAISSESAKLLETACFDQTLNQVWFDKLSLTNQQVSAKIAQIPSIITVGLLAPLLMNFQDGKNAVKDANDEPLCQEGIDYYVTKSNQSKWDTYKNRFRYFHTSPTMKMSYHFMSYVLFLLTFSYMMLYHLDRRDTFDIPHWTEIYVIITVSTMFCEEIRILYLDYARRTVERWGSTGSSVLTVSTNTFFLVPYFLFFLGLGFRYASYNDGILTTARIIWALDLELWYLQSLKFVMALKFLGPKLFMLQNMLRDLFAFLYMIFIAIAAYGVVSRSLILYQQISFTGRGIFSEIFYEPYWFIYGEISDKDTLDSIIANGTTSQVAQATATHVLLAFHMLFINILLLNLLIAVFADSIGKVQQNTEFYWRYQRYSFVREYFERLPLGYPPLIIIPHVVLCILYIYRQCCSRLCSSQVHDENHVSKLTRNTPIFKMIPVNDSQYEKWDLFENAATHSYARSVLEKNKNKESLSNNDEKSRRTTNTDDSNTAQTTGVQHQTASAIKEELMSTFKVLLTETQKGFEQNTSRLENRLDRVLEMLTKGKVNDSTTRPPSSRKNDGSSMIQPTTNPTE